MIQFQVAIQSGRDAILFVETFSLQILFQVPAVQCNCKFQALHTISVFVVGLNYIESKETTSTWPLVHWQHFVRTSENSHDCYITHC